MSEKYCIVLSMVLMLTFCEITSEACKLTITNDPDIPENMNKLICICLFTQKCTLQATLLQLTISIVKFFPFSKQSHSMAAQ